MASAERKHLIAACVAAVDLRENVAPNARLWLARASLKCDEKGRTKYSAERYADDTNDSIDSGERAIELLQKLGLVVNDVDEDGDDCLRLIHHQWDREDVITGYGRDAGQKRDGLPPQYGRTVADVIEPPSGRQDFTAPKWNEIRGFVLHQEEPATVVTR